MARPTPCFDTFLKKKNLQVMVFGVSFLQVETLSHFQEMAEVSPKGLPYERPFSTLDGACAESLKSGDGRRNDPLT